MAEVNLDLDLVGETDATVWAKKWIAIIAEKPSIPTDEMTMVAWFASALMSGYDQGRKVEQRRNFMEKLHEIIFQAVGASTGVMIRDNPDYVFPSEEIIEEVERVLAEFGIPRVEGY